MFKNRKFQYLIPLAVVLAIAIFGFAMGCVYDKTLSQSLYNRYQLDIPVFSTIFCLVGPLVTNCFGAFSGTALFLTTKRKSKFWNILIKLFAIVGLVMTSYFAYTSGTEFILSVKTDNERLKAGLDYGTLSLILLLDALIIFFTYKFVKKLDGKKVFWVALTMLIIIGGTAIAGEIVKYLASRPRPRLIFTDPGYEFKEWYQWNPLYGFKVSECKSFISGHSNNAATLITLLPLFFSLTKLSNKKYFISLTASIGGIYWGTLMLSRILAIAHFLTDAAGGCILSIFLQVTILFVMERILKKTGDFAPASN